MITRPSLSALLIAFSCIGVVGQEQSNPAGRRLPTFDVGKIKVPEGDVSDVAEFLQEMTELKQRLASDYHTATTKITAAQSQASNRILDDPDGVSDDAFAIAAQFGLANRVRKISRSTKDTQRKTFDLVKRQLSIATDRGARSSAVSNANTFASYLERYGDEDLALTAYRTFADLINKTDDPKLKPYAERFEGSARRLELLGNGLELEGKVLDDSQFDWTAYRGKVVLVDFWATWCGPCISEAPNVRRCYEAYHDRGFEVVGISLDSDRKKLESYLAKNKCPWVNIFEPGAKGKHPMALKYGVQAIPTAILVGVDGKVVSLNARGSKLREQLESLLGPPTFDGDWQSIIDSLVQRLQDNPDNTALLNELATTQARAEKWDDCVRTYRKLFSIPQQSDQAFLSLASVLLLAEDHDAHEELCKDFKSRMGESPSVRRLYLYGRALALDLDSENAIAVDPANRAVEMSEAAHHLDTLATAHLRAGNWDDAIVWAKRAAEMERWNFKVCDWLVLAIAWHERGDKAKSSEWMAKSVQWFRENERRLNPVSASGLPSHPHNWLAAQILRRGANQRLGIDEN